MSARYYNAHAHPVYGRAGLGETLFEQMQRFLTEGYNAGLDPRVDESRVGRNDVIKFAFDTTTMNRAGSVLGITQPNTERFRAVLQSNGWADVRLDVTSYVLYDRVVGEARCISSGFGSLQDAAQAIAGLAWHAGIGVSYGSRSPIAEKIATAGSGYRPKSEIDSDDDEDGDGPNWLIIGALALGAIVILKM
ncbi:MAG TPA: hypothetical protein VF528_09780 [Pyrinomonadaceae bacterium]|jgi:hypothetical protein